MTLYNRFYNWWHKVKKLEKDGCKNVAIVGNLYGVQFVTKWDWSQPFEYTSEKIYPKSTHKKMRKGV